MLARTYNVIAIWVVRDEAKDDVFHNFQQIDVKEIGR